MTIIAILSVTVTINSIIAFARWRIRRQIRQLELDLTYWKMRNSGTGYR